MNYRRMVMRTLIASLCILIISSVAFAADTNLPTTTTYNPIAPLELVQRHSGDADAACDNLGLCGNVTGPGGTAAFLGDFAFNCNTLEFAVTEVGGTDNLFTMSEDCVETGFGYHDPVLYASGRGLAYHQDEDVYFASSWNWYTTYALDTGFNVIATTYDGMAGAGNAVDEENGFLYQSTNSSPDQLVEYTINADYTVTQTQLWDIPWACGSDGYDSASLDYDDASGYFFIINQGFNALEWFSLSGGALVSEGCCYLSGISFGWGFGTTDEVVKITDIAAFYPPFPVYDVEAPLEGKCGGEPIPWRITYSGFCEEGVNGCGFPIAATVKNNTLAAETKIIYVTTNPPSGKLVLDTASFPIGTNTWYGCIPINMLSIPSGTYDLLLVVADSPGSVPDAEDEFTVILNDAGLQ